MLWIIDENTASTAPAHEMPRSAFFKAREDVTADLVSIGAKPLSLYQYYFREETDESLQSRVDGMLAGFKRGDTIIFQLPLFIRPKNIQKILEMVHLAYGGKAIAIIHDYEPFRSVTAASMDTDSDPWLDQYSYKTMPELVKLFDGLIVPSENFKEKLVKELEFEGPVIAQGPFSYHYYYDAPTPSFEKQVIFSSTVINQGFLENLPEEWPILLYGDQPNESILNHSNVDYKGSFRTTELPNHLPGGFGLVWDSDTYPGVIGERGEYTRLNYPHKMSLYLAAGLPLFVWEEAAVANWVVSNHLGYAIADLSEIKPYLDEVNERIYSEMQNNALRIGSLIRRGIYVKSAALEAVKQVNQVTLRF